MLVEKNTGPIYLFHSYSPYLIYVLENSRGRGRNLLKIIKIFYILKKLYKISLEKKSYNCYF